MTDIKSDCLEKTSLVIIIDYGMGNINSIGRVLTRLGVKWRLSKDPLDIKLASHLILPGVGHGGRAMHELSSSSIVGALNDAVFSNEVPILGICLGMQLMTRYTEEGHCNCLSWFEQDTIELSPKGTFWKVPNIGWHTLISQSEDELLSGLKLTSQPFYFCHRYGVPSVSSSGVCAELEYDRRYAAILRKRNIIGVQFHPEKSQGSGLKFFENFLSLKRNV